MLLEDLLKGGTLVPVDRLFHVPTLHFNCSTCFCTLIAQQSIHPVLEKVAEFESVSTARLSG